MLEADLVGDRGRKEPGGGGELSGASGRQRTSRAPCGGCAAGCRLVHNALARVIDLIPDRVASCAATMGAVRERLGCDSALMTLRGLVSEEVQIAARSAGASNPMESA